MGRRHGSPERDDEAPAAAPRVGRSHGKDHGYAQTARRLVRYVGDACAATVPPSGGGPVWSPVSTRTERVRIAYVITRLNVGGPAVHVLLLAGGLDPERFDVVVIAGTPGPREGEMISLPGVLRAPRIVRVPCLGRRISPLDDLRAFVGLVRVLGRERPDIVHTHMAKAGALGRIAARLLRTRAVVHTFHGNVLSGYFGRIVSRAFLVAEQVLARLSDAIVALSPRQAAEIRALAIAAEPRLALVPLGVQLGPFLDAHVGVLRGELHIDAETPLVGIVARLVPIKGVDLFLGAAELVARTSPAARFIVVGDGQDRVGLERRVSEGPLAGRVSFLGWRDDLPAIFADLDVVVLSSRNEGTPTSIIEAMAAGCAIVATAVGGVPDLLPPGTGLLVPPGDVGALAAMTQRLLEDPNEREVLGLAARARASHNHDVGALVGRMTALYDALVDRAPLVASRD